VAAGTYKPDQGQTPGDRTATFLLQSGVTLKGGFAGASAPNPDARDVTTYKTVLSGDLLGNDVAVAPGNLLTEPTRAENSYHVVTGLATSPCTPAVLDGFTISGGNANGDYATDPLSTYGGGLFNYQQLAEFTVTDCTFTANSASVDGGGMYVYAWSRPTVTGCTFSGNQAAGTGAQAGGAGMGISWACAGTITGCTFSGNAGSGLAVTFDGWWVPGSPGREQATVVINCIFTGNTGAGMYGQGGGMYNGNHGWVYFGNKSLPPTKLVNCLFADNSAVWGGAIYNLQSGLEIINCTFAGNTSERGGAMLTFYGGEEPKMIPTVSNCILWNNGLDQIVDTTFSPLPRMTIVTYSDVQGGWEGIGNIDADPLFADAAGHLSPGSPCINAGNNASVPTDVATDLDSHPRIVNGTVDMGTFEFSSVESLAADFNGTPIPAGDTIWFNSVLKPQGLPGKAVTFRFTDGWIQSADGASV